MTPDKNYMGRQQVARAQAMDSLSPKMWEKKIAGALRMNGWNFWRDLDLPQKFAKANAFRMPGMTDYLGWKHFEKMPPEPLMKLTGCYKTDTTIFLFIEAKTGKAVTTTKQQELVDSANKCEGVAGYVARPTYYDELVELLGGEHGL